MLEDLLILNVRNVLFKIEFSVINSIVYFFLFSLSFVVILLLSLFGFYSRISLRRNSFCNSSFPQLQSFTVIFYFDIHLFSIFDKLFTYVRF